MLKFPFLLVQRKYKSLIWRASSAPDMLTPYTFVGKFTNLNKLPNFRWSLRRCSANKMFLKFPQNSQQKNCALRVSDTKETLVQVFSCEFCENFKNTFYTEHLRAIASGEAQLELRAKSNTV